METGEIGYLLTNDVGEAPVQIITSATAGINYRPMLQLSKGSQDQEPLQSPKQQLTKAMWGRNFVDNATLVLKGVVRVLGAP